MVERQRDARVQDLDLSAPEDPDVSALRDHVMRLRFLLRFICFEDSSLCAVRVTSAAFVALDELASARS